MLDIKTPTPNASFNPNGLYPMMPESKKGRRANVIKVHPDDLDEIDLDKIAFFPSLVADVERQNAFGNRLPQAFQAWEAVMAHLSRREFCFTDARAERSDLFIVASQC